MLISLYFAEPRSPFPVNDVVLVPALLSIFLHSCEIKSGSGLGTRLYFAHNCTKHRPRLLPSQSEATPHENHLYNVQCSGDLQAGGHYYTLPPPKINFHFVNSSGETNGRSLGTRQYNV